jgi:hypothetical protein
MNFCDVDETKIQRRHVCWCRPWSTINGGVGSPREKPVRWPRLGGCAILAQRWRPTRRRPRRTRHNSIKSFILICLSRACPDGEIGRRSGLKIRRPQGRGGSSPPLGTKDKTIKINNLQRHEPLTTGGAFVVQTALVPVLVPVCTWFAIFGLGGPKPCQEKWFAKSEEFSRRGLARASGVFATTSMAGSDARRRVVAATRSSCTNSGRRMRFAA